MLGNEPVRFGGRPHGKGPAQQAPRRAADPAVKVNGVWRYVYRAIDQDGQVIDVLFSTRRDAAAARRFFTRALRILKVIPSEVVTDAAPVYPAYWSSWFPRPGTTSSSMRTSDRSRSRSAQAPAETDARTAN
jgi:transposase-like protein